MKLYKNSDGVWAGTQLDARKMCGKGYSTVDVPTDKPGLLKFLNLNKVGSLTDNDKQQEVSDDGDSTRKLCHISHGVMTSYAVGNTVRVKTSLEKLCSIRRHMIYTRRIGNLTYELVSIGVNLLFWFAVYLMNI